MSQGRVKSMSLIYVDTDDEGAHLTLIDPDGGARNLTLAPGARVEIFATSRIPTIGVKEHPPR